TISLNQHCMKFQERLTVLESSLPTRVDAVDVSRTAKLPFKRVLWYRESLIWRMVGLSRVALDSFQNAKLASAKEWCWGTCRSGAGDNLFVVPSLILLITRG